MSYYHQPHHSKWPNDFTIKYIITRNWLHLHQQQQKHRQNPEIDLEVKFGSAENLKLFHK